MSLKVLDCTIRDGGHVNRWFFDSSLVAETYRAAWQAGVSHVEVGYRHLDAHAQGPFARCTDDVLRECLPVGEGSPRPTVMVDASRGDAEAFLAADDPRTLVETVRVAAYPADLPVAFELLRALGFKGYEVCLNVMAVHALEAEHLEALRRFAVAGVADWLCLGDSFGALRPSAIRPLVERFTALGFERLGFHPHNNMQLAFANTLEAVAAGVTMVDATAFGMGRGAGNLPMELWLGHLEDQGCPGIQAAPYLDLVARRFEPLQAELGWGYSVARVLSGLAGVHPAYVAELLAEPGAAPGAVWAALPALRAQWPMAFEVVAAEATRGGPCAR